MTEKLTRLVTPKGSLPDLEAIDRHLAANARRLGSVLVQEVITYTDMNDPEYVPVLRVGALKGSNYSRNFLELNVNGSAVKLPRGEKPLGVGVARIASNLSIVYEDPHLIEEWDSLFEHYGKLLKEVEPRHIWIVLTAPLTFPL